MDRLKRHLKRRVSTRRSGAGLTVVERAGCVTRHPRRDAGTRRLGGPPSVGTVVVGVKTTGYDNGWFHTRGSDDTQIQMHEM